MSTGDPMCGVCGSHLAGHAPGSPCFSVPGPGGYERGFYSFTPNSLTEDDMRRIVREEIERAKENK
jgi:hypothetical protein